MGSEDFAVSPLTSSDTINLQYMTGDFWGPASQHTLYAFPSFSDTPVQLRVQLFGTQANSVINSGDKITLTSLEAIVERPNFLGKYDDGEAVYYYSPYQSLEPGEAGPEQQWAVRHADLSSGPINFGDAITLESLFIPGDTLRAVRDDVLDVGDSPPVATWIFRLPD